MHTESTRCGPAQERSIDEGGGVSRAIAATGASLGKLNLTMEDAPRSETRSVYRRRSTGQVLELRFAPTFAARFTGVPPAPRRGRA